MTKYRIRKEVRKDGTTWYIPQRKVLCFWVALKEESAYDSWVIIRTSEAQAREAIKDDKNIRYGRAVDTVTYEDVE